MKFTKKTLVSLLAFLLVLSSLTGFSLITDGFAADELKLITSVSTDTFSQGDTVTVTVSLEGSVSTKTAGLVLTTAYDHEAFEWVDGDFSESIREDALLAVTNPGKDAAFVYLNETAVTGEIFTFTLKATEKYNCGETYEIKAMPSNVLNALPEGKTLVAGHAYENVCDSDCNVCGEKRSAAHDFTVKKQTGRLHWTECSLCGEIDEASRGAHVYDHVKDTLCKKCGYTRPIPAYVYAVHRGDEVTVTFTVSNAQAVTLRGLGLDLLDSYDGEVFEWVSGAWSKTVLDNAALHQVKPASEAVFASKKEFALSGEVFTVVLKVKEDAPLGDYDVVLGIRGSEVLQLSNAVVTVHECKAAAKTERDADGHWNPCENEFCTEKLNYALHVYDNACDAECNVCGETRQVPEHVYDSPEDPDCNVCGYERPPYLPGDTDGDGDVDLDDAIYLLFHVNFQASYPVNQPVDFDNSGEVDLDDAIYLLFHVNFKESYPLFPQV